MLVNMVLKENRYCKINLISFFEEIICLSNKGDCVDIINMDVCKAFYCHCMEY